MFCNKLFGLHKHTPRSAAGIKHTAFVGFEHFYQEFNNTSGGVELSAFFAFGKRKFTEEIFKYMAENIRTSGFCITKGNVANQIDKFSQAGRIKVLASIDFGQNTFQRWVFLFDSIHRFIYRFSNRRLFGLRQQM